jgi:hypothetical protein
MRICATNADTNMPFIQILSFFSSECYWAWCFSVSGSVRGKARVGMALSGVGLFMITVTLFDFSRDVISRIFAVV